MALARNIRAMTETEQFDLKGVDPGQGTDLVKSCFTDPLPTSGMVRCTFVIGGGKKVRQKYHADLPKALTSALRELGYEEDQGASCVTSCQAKYKQQKDTGRDLVLLHVFPRITEQAESKGEGGGAGVGGAGAGDAGGEDDWRDLTPTMMAATAKTATLEKMVAAKTPSWSQKKRLLDELKDLGRQLRTCDEKLMTMAPLTTEEQRLYDATSTDDIAEKVVWLAADVKKMVQDGKLTRKERETLLSQVERKLEQLGEDSVLSAAAADTDADKEKAALEKRKEKLSKISPVTHALRRERELLRLYAELLPLEKLANTSRLLDAAEMRSLARKSDLDEQVDEIAASCRGWFEEDDEFAARLAAVKARAKPAGGKKKGGGSRAGGGGGGWGTVSRGKGGGGGAGRRGGGGSKSRGGAFAGLADSDSD